MGFSGFPSTANGHIRLRTGKETSPLFIVISARSYFNNEWHIERYSLTYPPPKNTQCPAMG